jgi:hypothetical protein
MSSDISSKSRELSKITEDWGYYEPKPGDAIRVLRKIYRHYGLFVGDGKVIEFGSSMAIDSASAGGQTVHEATLAEFLGQEKLEVRRLSKKELKLAAAPADIISSAYRRLGQKGYDALHNNCEHFVNEVIFGVGYSRQVDDLRQKVEALFKK